VQTAKKKQEKPTPPTNLSASDLLAWYSKQKQLEVEERKKREEAEAFLRGYRPKLDYQQGTSSTISNHSIHGGGDKDGTEVDDDTVKMNRVGGVIVTEGIEHVKTEVEKIEKDVAQMDKVSFSHGEKREEHEQEGIESVKEFIQRSSICVEEVAVDDDTEVYLVEPMMKQDIHSPLGSVVESTRDDNMSEIERISLQDHEVETIHQPYHINEEEHEEENVILFEKEDTLKDGEHVHAHDESNELELLDDSEEEKKQDLILESESSLKTQSTSSAEGWNSYISRGTLICLE
jgi:hypothetical protein